MTVLVTGVAGFIGMHVAEALLARGEAVLGVDELNAYYDPALKRARLARLDGRAGFAFVQLDLAEAEPLEALLRAHGAEVEGVVHLAAQAGVRWSLERPMAYARANLSGHLVVLEAARRHLPRLRHLVYASSSSVYGANTAVPMRVADRVDHPVSLYAATKRADELMSEAYARLYDLPLTGLRFFTVYGPWGRPDMAYYAFANELVAGRPITLYAEGRLRRDFTFVDDAVAGVLAALDRSPAIVADAANAAEVTGSGGCARHRLYNIGSHDPVEVLDLVRALERSLGVTAELRFAPMQPGDVARTYADIAPTTADLGWRPSTSLPAGIERFVAWHRTYHARDASETGAAPSS